MHPAGFGCFWRDFSASSYWLSGFQLPFSRIQLTQDPQIDLQKYILNEYFESGLAYKLTMSMPEIGKKDVV